MDMAATGAYIRQRRAEKGLTQADMPERLGLTPDTSADAIWGGGREGWRLRRRVTMAQLREVMSSLRRIGELLGGDHFIYRTMIAALDERMNAEIEGAFTSAAVMDAYPAECAIECVKNGDYVDPGDLIAHLKNQRALDAALARLREQGIR